MVPSPPDADAITALAETELALRGFLAGASNHTLLVQVGPAEAGLHGVYKPRSGERPLWDFPPGSLCQREVAAYLVSAFLGWDLVPPTVLRDGPLGVGSVQLFLDHDPRTHYFTLIEDKQHRPALVRLALFDLLVNNADRKGGHVLWSDHDDRLFAIDHGLTFHAQPKLRTVVWDLGGARVPAPWRADLARLEDALRGGASVAEELTSLLTPQELALLERRARLLSVTDTLPDVSPDRRPYPWPPL